MLALDDGEGQRPRTLESILGEPSGRSGNPLRQRRVPGRTINRASSLASFPLHVRERLTRVVQTPDALPHSQQSSDPVAENAGYRGGASIALALTSANGSSLREFRAQTSLHSYSSRSPAQRGCEKPLGWLTERIRANELTASAFARRHGASGLPNAIIYHDAGQRDACDRIDGDDEKGLAIAAAESAVTISRLSSKREGRVDEPGATRVQINRVDVSQAGHGRPAAGMRN